jgi:integrase/recombinase XerC
MPLKLYKRAHAPRCLAKLAAQGIIDPGELQNYRQCRCAWWVSGTASSGHLIPQRSLKVHTWQEAKEIVQKLNQEEAPNAPVTLARARTQWLTELRLSGRTEHTAYAYDRAVGKLLDFCAKQGVVHFRHVTTDLLNQLRLQWVEKQAARNTQNNDLSWIGMFFKFAMREGWMTVNPVKLLDRPYRPKKNADADNDEEDNATLPLDEEGDANYRRILAAITPYFAGQIARPGQRPFRARLGVFSRHPENFNSLCELMYETGLRISDAQHFRRRKLVVDALGASYTTRQIKTRTLVTVFLPPWLVAKIQALPEIAPGFVFFDGRKKWKQFYRSEVYHNLQSIGNSVGLAGVRAHRFRDSFAVNRLNEGMELQDLKDLLGHKSVATTEAHYAPFVKSRKKHLRARLLEAQAGAAKVIPIDQRQSA